MSFQLQDFLVALYHHIEVWTNPRNRTARTLSRTEDGTILGHFSHGSVIEGLRQDEARYQRRVCWVEQAQIGLRGHDNAPTLASDLDLAIVVKHQHPLRHGN